ncbi:TMPSC protease, partial [Rhinopomastus cyanomelas]|nr:TMPSC protease [Rhinopomastus cyanomelas]
IIGGHDAPTGAWPWSASLQVRQANGYFAHICGGVLIDERSVLTAAHCVTGRTLPHLWQAVLGVHNLYQPSRHTVSLRIRRIAVHPGFEQDEVENDLAFFELASAARLSAYIQPICLPPAQPLPTPQNQTWCFISGWGLTEEKGQGSAVLKEAQVEIIPLSICKQSSSYGRVVTTNMICAGSPMGGVDSCLGDSGGPLACYHASTDRFYLMGITSFGVGCGRQRFPGVYVRVSQYRKWI